MQYCERSINIIQYSAHFSAELTRGGTGFVCVSEQLEIGNKDFSPCLLP